MWKGYALDVRSFWDVCRLYSSKRDLLPSKKHIWPRKREQYIDLPHAANIRNIDIVNNSLCTDVTLDEARERTSVTVSWMKIPCSGHVDFPQICGKASDWTVLYLNNI
jgi:hypothetical protein